jgi:hypothetical protein
VKVQITSRFLFRRQAIWALFSIGVTAQAQVNLPPLNLGSTSYMDGVAGPGTLTQIRLSNYRSNSFRDASGDEVPGDNSIQVTTALGQIAHISKTRILGGYYGAEVLLPVVSIDPDTDFGLQDAEWGTGDLIVSPLLIQWPRSEVFGIPLYHRLAILFTLPTGKYDSSADVNPGTNALSFNPYYAITLLPSERWETSFRFHYLWNSENDDPNPRLGADDTQAGQAFHVNYAVSYQIKPHWRMGVSGYYLKQFTDDKIDGIKLADSKEQVFGFGPGFRFDRNKFSIRMNYYFETAVENSAKGNRVNLSFSKVF